MAGPYQVWPWRNVNLLSAKMSIANISSLQLKAGKGPANVPIFRRDGWPSLAEWGLCTPIGMPTNMDTMRHRRDAAQTTPCI